LLTAYVPGTTGHELSIKARNESNRYYFFLGIPLSPINSSISTPIGSPLFRNYQTLFRAIAGP
jgi:hypothetical protein